MGLKIPKSVRVLGRDYEIVRTRICPWQKDASIAAFHAGLGKIWLEKGRNKEEQHSGLFHEIHELILHEFCVRFDDLNDDCEFEFTHDKFRDINTVLWATIRDNDLFGREHGKQAGRP